MTDKPSLATTSTSAIREIRQPGGYAHVFSPQLEPIATVAPGETVAI